MATTTTGKKAWRPTWLTVAGRFSDKRACLASYLALETAEILAGAKPANLLNIVNRQRACGENYYQLWQTWGTEVLAAGGMKARVLADSGESLLVLIYRPAALATLLAEKTVQAVLHKAGYAAPADSELALAELERRLAAGGFPHEIGVFLGYPLKDVVGFLGWARLKFACQGPWKIYGDPRESLKLAEEHRQCRCRMAQQLAKATDPFTCLRQAA
jgi:hypothetical protein